MGGEGWDPVQGLGKLAGYNSIEFISVSEIVGMLCQWEGMLS